jgi:hypothetical protein
VHNQQIEGSLSGNVYVRPGPASDPDRYILHKRDKGEPGTDLNSLLYVRSIQLGDQALAEGIRKAAGAMPKPDNKRRSVSAKRPAK